MSGSTIERTQDRVLFRIASPLLPRKVSPISALADAERLGFMRRDRCEPAPRRFTPLRLRLLLQVIACKTCLSHV